MQKLLLVSLLFFGPVFVSRAADPAPSIEGVCPECVYPDNHETYSFRITGKDFGAAPTILFNDCDIGVTWLPQTKPEQFDRPYGTIVNAKEITLWGIHRSKYHGTVKLTAQTDGGLSNAKNINLSYVPAGWLKWIATGVTILVFGIPLIVLGLTRNQAYKIDGVPVTFLGALLLDPQTDTYSLSKFQFYVWTLAGVFGYVFLTIARSLVQGVFQFAPVPQNLPGIILVSGATTAVAASIISAKGPKGAGQIQPSISDFITTGGVVVAERFQFLIWTLLGAAGFIFLICFSDPCAIQDLPKIPQEFLTLMGLSSAGYLGGKLARKPGPVIDQIAVVRASAAELVLKITGTALSRDAGFKISDETGGLGEKEVKPSTAQGVDPRPTVIVGEDDVRTSGLAKVIELTISNPPNDWLPDALKQSRLILTITNPDGQLAVWKFEPK
jgi:hypothetical protein